MDNLGSILKRARQSRGMNQNDFADYLGISQPFLSRLETGKRKEVSHGVWKRITNRIPEIAIAEQTSITYDTRRSYERALLSYSEGEIDTAEELLEYISSMPLNLHEAVQLEIQLASRQWLAGIRRDKNVLIGENGAISLYTSILNQSITPSSLAYEIKFMLGACQEMLGNNSIAASTYRQVSKYFTNPYDVVRLSSRYGAVLTKIGEHSQARIQLENATQKAIYLDGPEPYSYAHEKKGIMLASEGKLSDAMNEILMARSEIKKNQFLRKIQSIVAEAYILILNKDWMASRAKLLAAKELARSYEYHHQVKRIDDFLNSIRIELDK